MKAVVANLDNDWELSAGRRSTRRCNGSMAEEPWQDWDRPGVRLKEHQPRGTEGGWP